MPPAPIRADALRFRTQTHIQGTTMKTNYVTRYPLQGNKYAQRITLQTYVVPASCPTNPAS